MPCRRSVGGMQQLRELPRISAPAGIFPSVACVGLLPGFLRNRVPVALMRLRVVIHCGLYVQS
ncbi:MAG: hypothetical protein DMF98_28350 [Acidobacteria bacterium]|nr:MAG: hypothetical protein DMF98_28350 [Acidobacteriota bacterium]